MRDIRDNVQTDLFPASRFQGWRYMGEWESGAPHGHGAVLADNGKISICSSFKKGRAHGCEWLRA